MSPAMVVGSGEKGESDTPGNQYQKGVKQLVENGLHTIPKKYILPPSDRPATNSENSNVAKQNLQLPIIDFSELIGPRRPQVLQSLANACERYGFFQLVNHGISDDVISSMRDVSGRFFDLPFEERAKHMTTDMHAPVRYGTSFSQTKDSVFCWRDFLKLLCHPLPDFLPHWPASPLDFRKVVATYSEETKYLFLMLMEAIQESLGIKVEVKKQEEETEGNDNNILKDLEDGSQMMVVNFYPPCPEPDLTLGMPPHSDYGFLTLLLQDQVEGLQIQFQGQWLTVKPINNAFVVNVGDHLEIYSNGKYKSVLHRVIVNAMKKRTSVASLHSLPFNCTARRRAVVPSLHKRYLSVIVDRVFCRCAERLVEKLQPDALNGTAVNMEAKFSQLTLDVIGLSVFNYNFDSLNMDSPVIEAVYTALKEAEARSTDLLPEIVESEGERIDVEEYVNDSDPSILRFLLASREEVSSVQLRDDLLSLLVAGHETTGSVLTWTLYLLSKDSSSLAKAQEEVDRVLQGRRPTYEDIKNLKFLTRCIIESLRLYPHPPVLIRRAQVPDELPGGYKLNAGQDIMISVYNIHRSSEVWDRAEEFAPERFDLDGPVPNETNTDFRFIPFSGGPRKCVGDQFALMEAIVALAIFLQHMNFELVPDQNVSMTTGATIHTTNGLYMKLSRRLK
ncbi:hypothetical protein JHK84_027320 [Glycine max]|nr:hypothetical protein JHK85_027711 [Glycine max]KAG5150848.1 hypothetical protein JHK84_027320 [Glycine max]